MTKFEYVCLKQLLRFFTTYYRMPTSVKCGTSIVTRSTLYQIYCKHFSRQLIDCDGQFTGPYKTSKTQFIRQLKSIHYEQ